MADIVNLRDFKKKKARVLKEAKAGQNRIKFGRTKAKKAKDESERKRAEDDLNQKRLEDEGPDSS